MKALLLVDLQNDFFPGGALGVKDADQIIPVINQLLENHFDLVVASKDLHPVNHVSFADTHGKKAGDKVLVANEEQILWPVHCVENSLGSEFSKEIHSAKIEKIFNKGTEITIDSYSAFFDNGHEKSTGLHEFLQNKEIKELYIAGLTTDYCVKYSALDALKLGYTVYIVLDACKAVNLNALDEQHALQEMLQQGAYFIRSKEIHG